MTWSQHNQIVSLIITKSKFEVNTKNISCYYNNCMYTDYMMISRREQNKINSRIRILKASRKLFSKKGYEQAMIDDIAREAEVSKATLYNYFPNKESLLIGIEQEVIEELKNMAEDDSGAFKNSEEKIRRVLSDLVLSSVEYSDLACRITYLNSCKDSALYDSRRDLENVFLYLIKSAKEEGIFSDEANNHELLDLVIGIYFISIFQWNHFENYTKEEIIEKVGRYYDASMKSFYK